MSELHHLVKSEIIAKGFKSGHWLYDDFCSEDSEKYFNFCVEKDDTLISLSDEEKAEKIMKQLMGNEFINQAQQVRKP